MEIEELKEKFLKLNFDEKEFHVDGDDIVGIADALYSLTALFLGGLPPADPYPDCGNREEISVLFCESFPGCTRSAGLTQVEPDTDE